MIQWLGSDNIEKTDLKKGDYIEIDLNSSFQYGRQVSWRTGWALNLKILIKIDISILESEGLKFLEECRINLISVKTSIYAYSIKKPKKFNLKLGGFY